MGIVKDHDLLRLFPHEKYEEFFREADTNNDGFISPVDLKKICQKYNYNGPDRQLHRCFDEANSEKNDKLSYEEFMNAMGLEVSVEETVEETAEETAEETTNAPAPQSGKGISVTLLRQIFQLFDTDGNGEIDKAELGQVFHELGRHIPTEDVQRMIDMSDKDGTGTLDYPEFIDILTREGIAQE